MLGRGDRIKLDTRFGTVAGRTWGSGPTVLLIHGWSGRSGQMTAFVEPLLEAGFRVVALDLPAHGESEGRMSSLVHFAAAITAAAHLCGPFHGVVAHSLGTSGVILAFSQGVHAQRVVFFAPPSRFDSVWERFRTGLGVRQAVWMRMIAKAERWLDVAFETVVPAVLAPRMHAPLLVIHDVGDREIAFEEGKELVELWPDATMRRTEGMGHARILKDPASVQAAVQFLMSADG